MREIKFRYTFIHIPTGNIEQKIYTLSQLEERKAKELSPCFDEEFGYKLIGRDEFTGLKDKNSREIYEGDLIRKKFQDREIGEFYAVGEVVFGTWFAGFIVPYKYYGYNKLERLSSEMCEDKWIVANREMEVIGNIHENHELLGS